MDLVIIIPGSVTKKPKLFRWFLKAFYRYYGVDSSVKDWTLNLKKYLEKTHAYDVRIFNWSGGVSERKSISPAAKELSQLLSQSKQYEKISIIAKSLGGRVAELALEEIRQSNIKKLIYIATPHNKRKTDLANVKIINVYSNEDKYLDLANKIIYFGRGTKFLTGAENIVLKRLRHSDFNTNQKVIYNRKPMRLYQLYQDLISREC